MAHPITLPASAERRTRLLGIGLFTLSTFIFGFSNVLAKWLTTSYPIGEALLIRSGFGILLLLPFLKLHEVISEVRQNPRMHAVRMVLTGIEIACFYWAVSFLQLADVTTFYLSVPVMLTAISALVLRERVNAARWVATVLGFIGVLIALRPTSGALSPPALIALFGCILYAIFLAITRRLRGAPSSVMVFLQLSAIVITGAVTIPFAWVTPNLASFGLMALVGMFGFCGYFCVNRALQIAPASVVAPFQYLSIIWSILLGYIVFSDVPETTTLAGAGLIMVAGGIILVQERKGS